MYEIIKSQFESGKSLTQSKYFSIVNRGSWPKFFWEMHPLAQEYYHELNPYFLFSMYRPDFYNFTKVFTVRDGYVTFASFLLNNISNFSQLGTELFIIPPDFAPLVPPNLQKYFAAWNIVQPKQISLAKASKVILFGFCCEQNLGTLDEIKHRLEALKDIHPDAKIELYLPLRRNLFDATTKESVFIHEIMILLKDSLKGRDIKLLTTDNFFDITNFKGTYVFDLAKDKIYVSDNYLHYYVQTRGGTVNNGSLLKAPTNSVFDLDMSFEHQLHVTPLPKVESVFMDLLIYKKQNAVVKDLVMDPGFIALLERLLKK